MAAGAGGAASEGAFVWHDLMSTDPARSAAFYAELVGWTCHDSRFWRGADAVAGLVAFDPELGWPSHWLGYVAAADVAQRVANAVSFGAAIAHPPTDTEEGSFAVIEDPDGALFGLVGGAVVGRAAPYGPGALVWDELLTEDDGVRRFYTRAMGWTAGAVDMGAAGAGWVFRVSGQPVASVLGRPGWPQPMWVPSIAGDPDTAARRAPGLGGRVVLPAGDLPDGGRHVLLEDPLGALVGVLGG